MRPITPIQPLAPPRTPTPAMPPLPAPMAQARFPFPGPPPTDDELLRRAGARPDLAWPAGTPLAHARNAHYTNTRHQLGWALSHDYNSLEGDVRLRDGVPVMAHDSGRAHELTFQQWATAGATSGRMLRIDLKEARAIDSVSQTLAQLGVPSERLTFNVSAYVPGLASSMSIARLKALRAQFPDAWITFNSPAPIRPGYALVQRAASKVGGKVGLSLQAQLVNSQLVHRLRQGGLTVSAWNYPAIWQPADVAAETRRLRELGIDGMIDLRRRDDPLADD